MFFTRALTALIALAVFAGALLLLPQWLWSLFLLPILFIAAWEWGGLARYGSMGRIAYATFVALCALAILYVVPAIRDIPPDVPTYALSFAFWIAIAPFWLRGRWATRNPFILGAAGWIALVPMWLAVVRLQANPWALLLFMSIVWIADTAAYLAGRQWGRRKLAPLISPGKSWEGVLGAVAAVSIYYAVLWFAVPADSRLFPALAGLFVFAVILALSIEGDLFESLMKRQAGLKDSGQLLPGHGGILDRIDGLTSTMPAAALALFLQW